jgi:hypothetical protein
MNYCADPPKSGLFMQSSTQTPVGRKFGCFWGVALYQRDMT